MAHLITDDDRRRWRRLIDLALDATGQFEANDKRVRRGTMLDLARAARSVAAASFPTQDRALWPKWASLMNVAESFGTAETGRTIYVAALANLAAWGRQQLGAPDPPLPTLLAAVVIPLLRPTPRLPYKDD